MKETASIRPTFVSEVLPLPSYLTHYFERSAGPFLNICDLSEAEIEQIKRRELGSEIKYNRFKLWKEFIRSRKAADDLLVKLYEEKFSKTAPYRPIYSVLGDFHKIPQLFADPDRVRVEIADLNPTDVTFMYPDHAHLIQYFDHLAPAFGAPLPDNYNRDSMPYYGKLYTYEELHTAYTEDGILERIKHSLDDPGSFVYCYVEAHIWKRDILFDG